MRNLVALLLIVTLAACDSDSGISGPGPGGETGSCSIDGQKQFVLDNLYAWYLWNDLLPANLSINDYASPEELVAQVTTTYGPQDADGNPVDLFSSVGSLQADVEFFGEGRFEGFGFSWRFADPASTEFRITRVFSGSPAANGGLGRGQRLLSLNGRTIEEIEAAEGVGAVFGNNDTLTFQMERVDTTVFSVSITKDIVTIDPVPQWRLIDQGPGVPPAGYLELSTFISTADAELDTVFAEFRNANVTDVILDLRYNGGGLVSTAELLGDFLGGDVAENLIFSRTEFNADRAAANNRTTFFARLVNSINLDQLVVIATRGTASASELVTNGLIPHATVTIVGDNTFGKPVGQIGLDFCEKILRPTSFRLANADGDGDYFDGLPVDCPANDELSIPIGDDLDPNMIAAMSFLNTGACPVVALPGGQFKPQGAAQERRPSVTGKPERDIAGAF